MFELSRTSRREKPSLITLLSVSVFFFPGLVKVVFTSDLRSSDGRSLVSGARAASHRSNRTALSYTARSSSVWNDVDGDDDRVTADGTSEAAVEYDDGERFAGDVDCPPITNPPISVRRITEFQVDEMRRLKEIHVRHNLKGNVEIRDGDPSSHVISVTVTTDAESEAALADILVDHRVVNIGDWNAILLMQVDYGRLGTGGGSSLATPVSMTGFLTVVAVVSSSAVGLLLVVTVALAVVLRRHRPGGAASLADAATTVSGSGRGSTMTTDETHASTLLPAVDCNVNQPTSLGDMRTSSLHLPPNGNLPPTRSLSRRLRRYNNEHRSLSGTTSVSFCSTTVADYFSTKSELERPNSLSCLTAAASTASNEVTSVVATTGGGVRHTSTGNSMATTASLLSVVVVALVATSSAGTLLGCADQRRVVDTVRVVIRVPISFRPDFVRVFYNERYRNPPIVTRRWTRANHTAVVIYDVHNVPATTADPCHVIDACPRRTRMGSVTSSDDVAACDWSTQQCVCSRGFSLVESTCINENTYDNPRGSKPLDDDEVDRPAHVTLMTSSNVFTENLLTARQLETTYYVTDAKQQTDFFWFRDSGLRLNIGLQNVDVIPVFEDVDHAGMDDTNFVVRNPDAKDDVEHYRSIVRRHCRHPLPDYYNLGLEISKQRTTTAKLVTCSRQDFIDGMCPDGVFIGDEYLNRTVNEPCRELMSPLEQLNPNTNSFICTDDSGDLLRRVFNITPSTVQLVEPDTVCKNAVEKCNQCLPHRCRVPDPIDRKCCAEDCYAQPECKMAASARCRNRKAQCANGDSYRFTLQPVFVDMERSYRCHLRRRVPDLLYQLWFYVSVPSGGELPFETPRQHVDVRPATSVRPNDRDNDAKDGRTMSSTSVASSLVSGHTTIEFLQVEFDAAIELPSEIIVAGRKSHDSGSGTKWSHVVESQRPRIPIDAQHPVEDIPGEAIKQSETVYVAAVDFEQPFGYSTSTWLNGNQCRKNVSLFVKPKLQRSGKSPSLSTSSSKTGSRPVGGGATADDSLRTSKIGDGSPVSVSVSAFGFGDMSVGLDAAAASGLLDGPLSYLIKSVDNPPQIRIAVPGNVSLLRWWFRDRHPGLVTGNTLNVRLSINETYMWISIEGHMTGCPGYLCVTVNEWPTGNRLIRHDVLVSCPSDFKLNFYIARDGNEHRLRDPDNDDGFLSAGPADDDNDENIPDDHVYECLLDDAKAIHRFLLMHPKVSTSLTASSSRTIDDERQKWMSKPTPQSLDGELPLSSIDDVHGSTACVVVVMVMVIVSFRLCSYSSSCSSVAFIPFSAALLTTSGNKLRIERKRRKSSAPSQRPTSATNGQNTALPAETERRQSSSTGAFTAAKHSRSSSNVRHQILITVYIIWKLLYSVSITLTVLSTVARIVVRKHYLGVIDPVMADIDPGHRRCSTGLSFVDRLNSEIGMNVADEIDQLHNVHADIVHCLRNLTPFATTFTVNRHRSSSHVTVETPAPSQIDRESSLPIHHSPIASFPALLLSRLERLVVNHVVSYRKFIVDLITTEWRMALVGYRKRIAGRIADNEWLQFARRLLNLTSRASSNEGSASKSSSWANDVMRSGQADAVNDFIEAQNERERGRASLSGKTFEDSSECSDEISVFMQFLGAYEAETVAGWPTALIERFEIVRHMTLSTSELLSDFSQSNPCSHSDVRDDRNIERTGSTMTSTPEADRTADRRISTSRYFSTSIAYDDEVSTPQTLSANRCDMNACDQPSKENDVKLLDYVLDVDDDDTLRIVFATVDLFLIASRWCCLHAALCGRGDHFRSPSPSRTGTVSGACRTSLTDSMTPRGAMTSTSIGVNGLVVAASRGDKPITDVSNSTKVGKTKKSCHCYQFSKYRSSLSSCGHHRDQQVARASNIEKSSSVTSVKQYEIWDECDANLQCLHRNYPVSSSFDPTRMASLTSTMSMDFSPVVAVRESTETRLGLDVRRESTDVNLGKITTCAVALLLIYVIVATFEYVVLEFTARSAAGITTDSDIWRLEGELHGVVEHQVDDIRQWYRTIEITQLSYSTSLMQSFCRDFDRAVEHSGEGCRSPLTGGDYDVHSVAADEDAAIRLTSTFMCRRPAARRLSTEQPVSNCSNLDAVDQHFRANVVTRQVLDHLSVLWNTVLIITVAVTALQLFNAFVSYFFTRWYRGATLGISTKRTSVGKRNRSIPDPEIHKMSFPTQPQQQQQFYQRRASADIAVTSANNMASLMTSYCGTWSGRSPHQHVRFSSTIEVLPPGSSLVSSQQSNETSTCGSRGGVRGDGSGSDSLRTFEPNVFPRFVLPAESKV